VAGRLRELIQQRPTTIANLEHRQPRQPSTALQLSLLEASPLKPDPPKYRKSSFPLIRRLPALFVAPGAAAIASATDNIRFDSKQHAFPHLSLHGHPLLRPSTPLLHSPPSRSAPPAVPDNAVHHLGATCCARADPQSQGHWQCIQRKAA
jgi:hypothetical protein